MPIERENPITPRRSRRITAQKTSKIPIQSKSVDNKPMKRLISARSRSTVKKGETVPGTGLPPLTTILVESRRSSRKLFNDPTVSVTDNLKDGTIQKKQRKSVKSDPERTELSPILFANDTIDEIDDQPVPLSTENNNCLITSVSDKPSDTNTDNLTDNYIDNGPETGNVTERDSPMPDETGNDSKTTDDPIITDNQTLNGTNPIVTNETVVETTKETVPLVDYPDIKQEDVLPTVQIVTDPTEGNPSTDITILTDKNDISDNDLSDSVRAINTSNVILIEESPIPPEPEARDLPTIQIELSKESFISERNLSNIVEEDSNSILMNESSVILISDSPSVPENRTMNVTFTPEKVDDRESVKIEPEMKETIAEVEERPTNVTFSPDKTDVVKEPCEENQGEPSNPPVIPTTPKPRLMAIKKTPGSIKRIGNNSALQSPCPIRTNAIRFRQSTPFAASKRSHPMIGTPSKITHQLVESLHQSFGGDKLKSIRKRSMSVQDDTVPDETITNRTMNRVTFQSPLNVEIPIADIDTKMKENRRNEQSFRQGERRKRSLSNVETDCDAKQSLKELNVPTKDVQEKKDQRNKSASKLPNFAAIHRSNFQRMESLDEYVERKAVRAKKLLSGQKPGQSSAIVAPSTHRSQIPTAQPVAKKALFNHDEKLKLKRADDRKKLFKSGRPTATDPIVQKQKRSDILKGVRTNRRFELQMKHRKNVN